MLNRAMAQPVLESARIVAGIRQCVTARMPEHVAMDGEVESSPLADALDQSVHCVWRERAAAFRAEHVARVGILPVKLAQCSQLIATDGMGSRLDAPYCKK
jgi:hypothetical protein